MPWRKKWILNEVAVTKKILVIAHRGASGTAPENTLKAFSVADEQGADGIELDLYLTCDNRLVVTHDLNTKRLTGVGLNVRQSTAAELQKLDYGQGERIPLLAEVLDLFLKKFVIINIEIKSAGFFNTGIEAALARMIKEFDCIEQVVVSSFNPVHLFRMRRMSPNLKLGFLLTGEQSPLARNRMVLNGLKPHSVNLNKSMQSQSRHRYFFKTDYKKWIWTVDKETEMDFWIGQEPEAIITNFPHRLVTRIQKSYDNR